MLMLLFGYWMNFRIFDAGNVYTVDLLVDLIIDEWLYEIVI